MAATILQWSIREDFDILVGEIQPEIICPQETKLDHSPHPKTYQFANYDSYNKALRRRDEQLPCGGVPIYINKTDVERRQTFGHSRSINPNMINHVPQQLPIIF